jgi:hypothetical protein
VIIPAATRSHRAAGLLLALVASLAACTGAPPAPAPSSQPTSAAPVPSIPEPAEQPSATPASEGAAVPAVRPRPGPHVLVHLEGPVQDAAATDVVLRTPRGVELDRFRLAGATSVHAGVDGRWAVVGTADGGWAVLDGATTTLTLLAFGDDAPTGTPRVRGALAWWQQPDATWVVRLDTATPERLDERLGTPVEVLDVSADGAVALLDAGGPRVLDTAAGEVVPVEGADEVGLGADGTVAAVGRRGDVALLTTRSPAGELRELALLPGVGVPVPLPDGGVAVLGTPGTVVGDDGVGRPLPDVPAVAGAPVVAADGRVVLAAAAAGLVVVDVGAGTAEVLPGTAGFAPLELPAGAALWAAPEAGGPGLVAVDAAAGTARRLLEEVAAGPIASSTADGAVVALATGTTAESWVTARPDGTVEVVDPGEGGRVVGVALHPSGEATTVAVVRDGGTALLLGNPDVPGTELPDARQPAWLRTSAG